MANLNIDGVLKVSNGGKDVTTLAGNYININALNILDDKQLDFQIQCKADEAQIAYGDVTSPSKHSNIDFFCNELRFMGYEIDSIVSRGDNYISYNSGLQICWFSVTGSAAKVTTHNFPIAFASGTTPQVFRTILNSGSQDMSQGRGWNISTVTNTNFSIYSANIGAAGTNSMILAIGKWK